jgi:hypothetical protein
MTSKKSIVDISDIHIPSDKSINEMSAKFAKSIYDPNPLSLDIGFTQGAIAMRTHFERELARLWVEVDKPETPSSLSPIQKLLMDRDFATVFALNHLKYMQSVGYLKQSANVGFFEKLKRIFSKKR